MPKTMLENLERIRELTQIICEKKAEYAATLPLISGYAPDGMPKGHSVEDKIDDIVDGRTLIQNSIKSHEREQEALVKEVIPFVESLPDRPRRLYSFCVWYYLGNHDFENVSVIMGLSKSTLYKYDDEIRKLGEKFG